MMMFCDLAGPRALPPLRGERSLANPQGGSAPYCGVGKRASGTLSGVWPSPLSIDAGCRSGAVEWRLRRQRSPNARTPPKAPVPTCLGSERETIEPRRCRDDTRWLSARLTKGSVAFPIEPGAHLHPEAVWERLLQLQQLALVESEHGDGVVRVQPTKRAHHAVHGGHLRPSGTGHSRRSGLTSHAHERRCVRLRTPEISQRTRLCPDNPLRCLTIAHGSVLQNSLRSPLLRRAAESSKEAHCRLGKFRRRRWAVTQIRCHKDGAALL
jgi:hypothetical protein